MADKILMDLLDCLRKVGGQQAVVNALLLGISIRLGMARLELLSKKPEPNKEE